MGKTGPKEGNGKFILVLGYMKREISYLLLFCTGGNEDNVEYCTTGMYFQLPTTTTHMSYHATHCPPSTLNMPTFFATLINFLPPLSKCNNPYATVAVHIQLSPPLSYSSNYQVFVTIIKLSSSLLNAHHTHIYCHLYPPSVKHIHPSSANGLFLAF